MYIGFPPEQPSKSFKVISSPHSNSLQPSNNFSIHNRAITPKQLRQTLSQPQQIKPAINIQLKQPQKKQNQSNNDNPLNNLQFEVKHIDNYSYLTSDDIGLGYASKVFKGKNNKTNQLVAIKVINLQTLKDDLNDQFLKGEISTLEAIQQHPHPNLLHLEAIIKTKTNIYIVTEFCEGKDLSHLLRARQNLNQRESECIMKQIVDALLKLYQLGIVHRDLKPSNIFIKNGELKLGDFGFAIKAQKCLQKFTYNIGTPYYMPPQTLKHNKYSHQSDIWALGVIAYELVHGKVPWKNKSDPILLQKINNTPIDTLIDPQLKLSDNYMSFIKSCLCIDVERRATMDMLKKYPWNEEISKIKIHSQSIQHKRISLPATTDRPKITFNKHQRPMSQANQQKSIQLDTVDRNQLISSGSLEGLFKKPSLNAKKQSPVFLSKLQPNSYQMQPKKIQDENLYNQTQQIILSQIHFCRFLRNIHQGIFRSNTRRKQLDEKGIQNNLIFIKQSIRSKILTKMKMLLQMCHTNNNILKINAFHKFIQSNNWDRIKTLIHQYHNKFEQEFKQQKIYAQHQKISIDELLKVTIKSLKSILNNHQNYIPLLELLVIYWQLITLDKNHSAQEFSKIAKVDMLPKRFTEVIDIQRLINKIQYMEL